MALLVLEALVSDRHVSLCAHGHRHGAGGEGLDQRKSLRCGRNRDDISLHLIWRSWSDGVSHGHFALAERKASEELQDAADNAAREKKETDEQRAVLVVDMKNAANMTAAAKKERDDCLRAQQRLDKEEEEAKGCAQLCPHTQQFLATVSAVSVSVNRTQSNLAHLRHLPTECF